VGRAKGGGRSGVYRGVAIYSRSEEEFAVKKFLVLAIVALVVPSVALAAKPNPPGKSQDTHGNPVSASHAPKVLYVLKGVLTAYTAAPDASTCPSSGSVTITVNRANHQRAAFKSLTQPLSLSFCVDPKTRIVVKGGGDLTLGDRGIVKVRYAKKFDPTDTAQLTDFQLAVAKQVIDQGPTTPTS
jgi:hypothetical protein